MLEPEQHQRGWEGPCLHRERELLEVDTQYQKDLGLVQVVHMSAEEEEEAVVVLRAVVQRRCEC